MQLNEDADREFRKLCRSIAREIAGGLVLRDMTLSDLDGRLGWKDGRSRKLLLRLLDGKEIALRDIAYIFRAMDLRVEFKVRDTRSEIPETAAAETSVE